MEFTFPRVIGLYHNIRHPDALTSIDFVKSTITPGQRIAVESPYSLTQIETFNEHAKPQFQFLHDLCTAISSRRGIVVPIENAKLYALRSRLHFYFMFEEHDVYANDWKVQKTTIMATHSLLALSIENKCETLVIGTVHAYHLQLAGCPHIHQVSALDPATQTEELNSFNKFGKPLTSYVQRILKN